MRKFSAIAGWGLKHVIFKLAPVIADFAKVYDQATNLLICVRSVD